MSSVRGLLEERERVARVAVEELQAEADRILAALGEAEMVLERRVIAREELSEALAVPEEVGDVPASDVPGQRPPPVGKAPVDRSRVPERREGMTAVSLSSEYRKIVELLEAEPGLGVEGMQAKEMTARLGLELTAAKIEGVRSRAKRLAERDWAERTPEGRFKPRASSRAN
ncbi:hypothetical protein [Streptomyces sp. KMM 9044]|uniref:hypothetical protein n=1 Tax=Streptomyces sp. KMM 9044 TaxID=2744474 RepID=UPI00215167A2|nr:hypothetical protein [Streptomyces sp. KMM 9044]WAX80194.1 hypothetical protein HUV60_023565 [Streptomyces sp. KMM 9044]